MSESPFLLGEFHRALDDRFRLSLPAELMTGLGEHGGECMLIKERPGCVSLWNSSTWQSRFTAGVEVIEAKLRSGRLDTQAAEIQRLGRLLSTRQRSVTLAPRGRLLIPEGFREFLQVESGGNVVVVGAAVCLEIWRPSSWLRFVERNVGRFPKLFDQLSR